MKRILTILGEAQYDVLNVFSLELINGFREYGIIVDIVNARNGLVLSPYSFSADYDLVFAFNGMWQLEFTDALLRDKKVPVWSFLVDHPLHHHKRLLDAHCNQIVSCIDRKHVKYVKDYYKNNNHVLYMPHGGILSYAEKGFDARKYDVSFFGTYKDPAETIKPLHHYNDSMKRLVHQLINEVYRNPERTMEDALDGLLKSLGVPASDEEFREILKELDFADEYLRNKKRHDVVEAVVRHGIKVDVFGTGWEKFQDGGGCLRIHEPLGFHDVLLEMAESKIVLNTMPLFTDGSHERIFNSMGAKCICFTDKSSYLDEIFQHGEELFYFSMNELDKLPIMVKAVLRKEYDIESIIEKAYGSVMKKHLWKHRAKEILDCLDKMKFE